MPFLLALPLFAAMVSAQAYYKTETLRYETLTEEYYPLVTVLGLGQDPYSVESWMVSVVQAAPTATTYSAYQANDDWSPAERENWPSIITQGPSAFQFTRTATYDYYVSDPASTDFLTKSYVEIRTASCDWSGRDVSSVSCTESFSGYDTINKTSYTSTYYYTNSLLPYDYVTATVTSGVEKLSGSTEAGSLPTDPAKAVAYTVTEIDTQGTVNVTHYRPSRTGPVTSSTDLWSTTQQRNPCGTSASAKQTKSATGGATGKLVCSNSATVSSSGTAHKGGASGRSMLGDRAIGTVLLTGLSLVAALAFWL